MSHVLSNFGLFGGRFKFERFHLLQEPRYGLLVNPVVVQVLPIRSQVLENLGKDWALGHISGHEHLTGDWEDWNGPRAQDRQQVQSADVLEEILQFFVDSRVFDVVDKQILELFKIWVFGVLSQMPVVHYEQSHALVLVGELHPFHQLVKL